MRSIGGMNRSSRAHPAASRNTVSRLVSGSMIATAMTARALLAADLTWDGGTSGTGSAWHTNTNWRPDAVPTTADNLLLSNAFTNVPTSMTISSSIGANQITFANNFNPTNTALIGSGSSTARVLTLGGLSSTLISVQSTGGKVTFQPKNGGSADLSAILLERGADPSPIDRVKKTAMVYAAGEGHTAIVRQLLARGVDANRAYDSDLTALMWAAGYGKTETVRALLDAGADPSKRDNRGKTAADIAREGKFDETARALDERTKR